MTGLSRSRQSHGMPVFERFRGADPRHCSIRVLIVARCSKLWSPVVGASDGLTLCWLCCNWEALALATVPTTLQAMTAPGHSNCAFVVPHSLE